MRQLLACAIAAVLLAPGAAQTPARPDFSGRWTADVPAPPAGRAGGGRADMGSGWGSPLDITQDAQKLTVQYAFFGRGDMQPPLRFIYNLDGSPSTNTLMMGRGMQSQTARASWNGDKLVITTMHTLADPATGKPINAEVTQTLSLDAGSLVVETTRAGVMGGPPSTTKTTYKKA
jgi:hypothetical protein